MKLPIIPLILSAGIAISQVCAAPLRVVVVSNHSPGFIRVGHAAAPNVATMHTVSGMHMRPKHGCAGSLRNKAMQITNWFRVTFHLRPATPTAGDVVKTGHKHMHPWSQATTFGTDHVHAHHYGRPTTFAQRLAHGLMMLGPWEGRAVAFILGCGIGVLIRMFWVLTVIALRSIRGQKRREEFIEDEVLFEEEEHLLAPPQYVDEHFALMEEKVKEEETPREA